MIKIEDLKDCCGCSACVSICPKKCISLIADSEGFAYPSITSQQCINCKRCEQVCPILNTKREDNYIMGGESTKEYTHRIVKKTKIKPDTYIGFIKDSSIRNESTSGGLFTAIANYVIEKKGVVFGVAIDSDNTIIHFDAHNRDQLSSFRGSKYVQSNVNDSFKKVRQFLSDDQWVLFSGTPCQIEGLKRFLGHDYEKLITIDIICHGVGSPKYWKKYVNYLERKYKSRICSVKFREKTYGYNSACMAVYFENGKSSHKGHDNDLYWSAFSKFYIFRPSCYECAFKQINHISDFTIGDFWDTKGYDSAFMKSNGCSLILIHSEKGKKLLEEIKKDIIIEKIDLERALLINGGILPSKLIFSAPLPENRNDFFKDMDFLECDVLTKKYLPLSIKKKIQCIVKPILYKIGLLNFAKEVMHSRPRV